MGYFFTSGLFEGLFGFVFVLFIAIIIFTILRGLLQRNKNNHSPQLTVEAAIVSKRMAVSHHNGGAHGEHMSTSTSYYVTFQVESGDRMELSVRGKEYGLLAEGDYGRLTFQGTRYLGFQRKL